MQRIPSLLLASLFVAAIALPTAARAELQAGTAVVDITPQQWPLAPRGSFTPRPMDSAHDPLNVRCLVLDDGKTSIVLAVVDSCMVHRDVLDPAKRQASEATGIPAEHMLISATHTHSAPFANAQHGTPQELAYQKRLLEGIVEAIVQASQESATGESRLVELRSSRRGLQPPLVSQTGHGSDQSLRRRHGHRQDESAAKQQDPHQSGRPDRSGVLGAVRRRCHRTAARGFRQLLAPLRRQHRRPDVGGLFRRIRATHARPRRQVRRKALSPCCPTAPAAISTTSISAIPGRGGNLSSRSGSWPAKRRMRPPEPSGKIDSPSGNLTLAMRQREITLKHRVPTAEQIERAKGIVEVDAEGEKKLPRLAKAYAQRTLKLAAEPPTTKVLIQTVRIGDLAICTLPFEVLVEIGLELKDKSPAADTFVVELANGGYGYLPTPEQHQFGGYETWLTTNKVQKDASVILVDNLLEMLGELFP